MDPNQPVVDKNDVEELLNGDAKSEDRTTAAAQRNEDHSTPAGDPDDTVSSRGDTHPSTDSDIDQHERYDQGT